MTLLQSLCRSATLWCWLIRHSAAWGSYRDTIPNGYAVTRSGSIWDGVGHFIDTGGGDRNPFGLAWAAERSWTTALCEEDSDGDGQTNGFELGDPDCVWTTGATPSRVVAISHPGFNDTYVDTTTNMTVITDSGSGDATTTTTTTTITTAAAGGVAGPCDEGASMIVRSGIETYACMLAIGGVELHWTVIDDTSLDFAMVRTMSAGYMSLGFPPSASGAMEGPAFAATADGSIGRYQMTPGDASETSDTNIPFPVTDATSETSNGQVIVRIEAADMSGIVSSLETSVNLLWATGTSGFAYHGSTKGAATVNFASGAATVSISESYEDDVKTHGILQITAWCFLAPFAVFLKRLGARSPAFQGIKVPGVGLPLPYVLHVICMLLAILLSLSGIGIAKDKFQAETEHGHGSTAFATMVMFLIQPFPAIVWQFCKPKDEEKLHKAKPIFGGVHKGLGIAIIAMASATCMSGINNYRDIYQDDGQADGYMFAALIGIIVMNSLSIVVEVLVCVGVLGGGDGSSQAGGKADSNDATTLGKQY
mmetsp:Transcript_39252/g.90679  ORF Transcript_39252/g.90679 Transcript_39252/m.90679 type:complete len:537 (-) Transcript_39252:321-1931(-)